MKNVDRFRSFVSSLKKAGWSADIVWATYLSKKSRFRGVGEERARFIILQTFCEK